MLKYLLAVGIIALLIGSVAANASPEVVTIINGTIEGCQVGLLVPQNTDIPLVRGSNNEKLLGTVTIIGCTDGWDFDIVPSTRGMHIAGNNAQVLPQDFQLQYHLQGGDWSGWTNAADFPYLVGNGTQVYEFWMRQPVGLSDPGGEYEIALYYQMNALPPSPPPI